MGEAGVCLSVCPSVSCFRPCSEMLHQALREAGHKWHSSQSCCSFLTHKGICRPTTLVAFFLSQSLRLSPREELTIWEWKQVVFAQCILQLKRAHAWILSYRLVPTSTTTPSRRRRHICCFSGHACNACHPEVKPQFLFGDFSSWLAATTEDVQWWNKFCHRDFSAALLCCGRLRPLYHTSVWFIYTANHRTIKRQCQKFTPRALLHRGGCAGDNLSKLTHLVEWSAARFLI